jgi:putative SOS response-associated peptidase YedK
MCGRFTLTRPSKALKDWFPLYDFPDLPPRYNIAPTQPVVAIRRRPGSSGEAVLLRWGLIPHWADDPAIGNRLINARCESAAEKPAFRSAFQRRRCLVLADGFFEWRKTSGQEDERDVRQGTLFGVDDEPTIRRPRGKKQPYHIRLRDGQPFAFAGLWDAWDKERERIESCTILTTDANKLVLPLHDRMPVILPAEHYDLWLDPEEDSADALQAVLQSYPADAMTASPVNPRVNDPRHDDPSCVAAVIE